MADDQRAAAADVAPEPKTPEVERAQLLAALEQRAYAFDFYQVLRRLECAYRDRPRWGMAQRPSEEPLRLGQDASLAIATSAITRFIPEHANGPARLQVNLLGMLGPSGSLPLHITGYARQRAQLNADRTLSRFLDIFHHRMLALYYRTHSAVEPTIQHDRSEADRFAMYVAALIGVALPAFRERDALPDRARLYYAGLLAPRAKNAAGLRAMVEDYLRLPVRIEECVGEWVTIPRTQGWALGQRGRRDGVLLGKLGKSALVGTRVWLRQHRFRVVLGPLRREQFRQFLPGTPTLMRLIALVRNYIGDELKWDVRLTLLREAVKPLQLGAKGQLGRTSWLVARRDTPQSWEDLIIDPERNAPPSGAQARGEA